MSLEEQYAEFKELISGLTERERKDHVESSIRNAIDSGALVAFRLVLEARLFRCYSEIKGADKDELYQIQARIGELVEILELLNREGSFIESKAGEDAEYYTQVNNRFLIPDSEMADVDAG